MSATSAMMAHRYGRPRGVQMTTMGAMPTLAEQAMRPPPDEANLAASSELMESIEELSRGSVDAMHFRFSLPTGETYTAVVVELVVASAIGQIGPAALLASYHHGTGLTVTDVQGKRGAFVFASDPMLAASHLVRRAGL